MLDLAYDLKLHEKRFKSELHGARCSKLLAFDNASLLAVAANGVPTIFINGRFTVASIDLVEKAVVEELAKVETAIKGGIKADAYYDTLIKNGTNSVK